MKKIIILFFTIFIQNFFAQTIPQVNIPIVVTDGIRSKTLYFGLDPTATDRIDTHLDEMEQPPLPPSGIFDARFIGYDINIPELGEGVLKDYRFGFDTTKGVRLHELRYQVGTGTTITIKWDLPQGITGLLQDFFGGIVVNKNMIGKDSLVVSNPGIINKLKLTVTYNLNGNLLPSAPNLISPLNNSTNVFSTPELKWTRVSGSNFYHLQVSLDSLFTNPIINDSTIQTNSVQVNLQNGKKYFWRVRSKNNAGWSPFSVIWNFKTIASIPDRPILKSPSKGAFGVSVPVQFEWFSSPNAENYTLIVDADSSFSSPLISETVFDTTFSASNLNVNTTYFWQVIANNFAGSSQPSEIWYFTTLTTSVEDHQVSKEFYLSQNFPNPFNSSTKIFFRLPEESFTKLIIYNSLGELIANPINEVLEAGSYEIELNLKSLEINNNLTSGIYFYKIITPEFSDLKKMVYLK